MDDRIQAAEPYKAPAPEKRTLDQATSHLQMLGAIDLDGFNQWVILNPGGVCVLIQSLIDRLPIPTHAAMLESLAAQRPSPPHVADALDGERWRAVLGCARIRVLGSAGLHSDLDTYGNRHGSYGHIGLELWTKHDAPSFPEAIADFIKFADKAIAARAEAGGQRAD